MAKKSVFFVVALVLLFAPLGLGAVSYDIQVEDGSAFVNASIEFTSSEKVTVWNGKWSFPEGAEILGIKDSRGEIEEYEKIGDKIEFKTNRGPPRKKEVVKLRYSAPADIEKWGEIKRFSIKIPSISDERNSVRIEVPEPVLGTSEKRGFQSSFEGNTAKFRGNGPVNLKVSYTEEKGDYENYIVEGDINLTAADNYYPVLTSFTGVRPDFRKFAVVVMPDREYEEEVEQWSAGSYESPGLIFVKNSSTQKETLTGLVLHETMHGFNQKPLNWVQVQASMFDEGVSKFVETYVNQRMGVRQPELFGDTQTWEARCEDQPERNCRYSLRPRGTPEQLQSYYDRNKNFMERWTPADSNARSFGYAYAELLVREYLRKNGATALRNVYDEFKDLETARTYRGYTQNLKKAMETDLKPCHPLKDEELLDCLEESREYHPDVPESVKINGTSQKIDFKPINISRREKAKKVSRGVSELGGDKISTERIEGKTENFFQGFGNWIVKQFEKLINLFR